MEPVLTQEELDAIYVAMRAESETGADVEEVSLGEGRVFAARSTKAWNEVAKSMAPGVEAVLASALGRRLKIDVANAFLMDDGPDGEGEEGELSIGERPVTVLLAVNSARMLLGLERSFVAQFIERRTGAAPESDEADCLERELTSLERSLLRNLLEKLVQVLVKAAPALGPARVDFAEDTELDDAKGHGGPWMEVGFEERKAAGIRIWLRGPAALLLPRPAVTGRALAAALNGAAVELRVELGRCRMNVADVCSLERGAFLALGTAVGDPVRILIGGIPKLRGEPLVSRGNIAVRVLGRLEKGVGA
jgi:flagellar motor switch protein FliM